MPDEADKPVTRTELQQALDEHTDKLIEVMRGMQTEILRGFEAWAGGETIRLRKLEADHSNLDAATSGRIAILERRLFEIEKRLLIEPKQ